MDGVSESNFPIVDDINVPHEPCICNTQATLFNGRRYAVCKAYVNPIQHRPNFKIVKCAVVTRVLFKGNKAIGVEFYYKDKRYEAYARKEVVLCAGVIGSPLILQQSGIGLQEDLNYNKIKSWLPLPVGRNLQDHLAAWIWLRFSGPAESVEQLFGGIVEYLNCPRSGIFSGIGTLATVLFANTTSNPLPHIECYFLLFTKQSLLLPGIIKLTAYSKPIADKILQTNQDEIVVLVIPSLLDPKSRGNVRLDGVSGPNAFLNPYIFYNYFSESYDKISLREAIKLVISFLDSPTWKAANGKFILLPLPKCEKYTDKTSDEYYECYLYYMGATVYHPGLVFCLAFAKNDKKIQLYNINYFSWHLWNGPKT